MSDLLWIIVISLVSVGVLIALDRVRFIRGFGRPQKYCDAVRVAIVHDNKLFLVPHRSNVARLKHPLYTEIDRKESKEAALKRLMDAYLPNFEETPKFLLKYQQKRKVDDTCPKIIFLYVLNLTSEDVIEKMIPEGSFVDCHTIDSYANDGRLSDSFLEEFAYLRNTIILCNSLLSHRNKKSEK